MVRTSSLKYYAFLLIILSGCATLPKNIPWKPIDAPLPQAEREFRAAWVASVANINWPSKPGLGIDKQKEEAIFLLDLLAKNNFNAVILQVRPQCDALYQSELEPWSYYLTGKQGQPPVPFYDPLVFWIEQAHLRGLELHAWLNPYRAHHITGGEISENSIIRIHPELVVELENGTWWLDPGKAGTQDHSMAVALDIVKRYDIDGLHFDDYFYPYPSYNNDNDFPDESSWQSYVENGGTATRNDWRRENVNIFIKYLYRAIKDLKPHVKFGLSPFGIWRPEHPPSIRGFDQYDQLYADARLWINEGWLDYLTPQLYWPINQIPQSFPVLLGWWIGENKKNRHIWPGINIGRLRGATGEDEMINQIMITRGMVPDGPGVVHWSIGPLVADTLLLTQLGQGPYKKQALIPASIWLDDQIPSAPEVEITAAGDSLYLSITQPDRKNFFHWVVYSNYNQIWDYQIYSSATDQIIIPLIRRKVVSSTPASADTLQSVSMMASLQEILISAVNQSGLESKKLSVWKSEPPAIMLKN